MFWSGAWQHQLKLIFGTFLLGQVSRHSAPSSQPPFWSSEPPEFSSAVTSASSLPRENTADRCTHPQPLISLNLDWMWAVDNIFVYCVSYSIYKSWNFSLQREIKPSYQLMSGYENVILWLRWRILAWHVHSTKNCAWTNAFGPPKKLDHVGMVWK